VTLERSVSFCLTPRLTVGYLCVVEWKQNNSLILNTDLMIEVYGGQFSETKPAVFDETSVNRRVFLRSALIYNTACVL
jgi:hypothetical protein